MPRYVWTPEQVAFLRQHYPSRSTRWIAAQLGYSSREVCLKAGALGLRKCATAAAAERQRANREPEDRGRKVYPELNCPTPEEIEAAKLAIREAKLQRLMAAERV